MAGEGASSIGAAVASEEFGTTAELGTLKSGTARASVTPSATGGGVGSAGAGGVGTAVGGPVGAKLFGTDVDQIQLLEFYSGALILSGVGKDYDDKTIQNILGLFGDDFTSTDTIGCITAEEYEQEHIPCKLS